MIKDYRIELLSRLNQVAENLNEQILEVQAISASIRMQQREELISKQEVVLPAKDGSKAHELTQVTDAISRVEALITQMNFTTLDKKLEPIVEPKIVVDTPKSAQPKKLSKPKLVAKKSNVIEVPPQIGVEAPIINSAQEVEEKANVAQAQPLEVALENLTPRRKRLMAKMLQNDVQNEKVETPPVETNDNQTETLVLVTASYKPIIASIDLGKTENTKEPLELSEPMLLEAPLELGAPIKA